MAGQSPSYKILFVCIENSNRSQMAEAFARIHGSDEVEPYSAGSRPGGTVNARAIAAMRKIGYELGTHRSKALLEVPDVEYDWLVTMGCGDECPFVRSRHRVDWEIPDPKSMEADAFREVRDLIEQKVRKLLDRLINPYQG
jgi:arsenate reductase